MKYQTRPTYVEAVQFRYIDGIDGPLTVAKAKELGLSRNGSSLIWEVDTKTSSKFGGWYIVHDGDYIVTDSEGGKHYFSRDIFEKMYETAGEEDK